MSQTNPQQHRENPEPYEGSNPIPKLVLAIIGLLLLWAVYYLYSTYHAMPAAVGDNRIAADFAVPLTADGGQLYGANCVACHQASGAGVPGVFPPLANSEWVDATDPEAMIRIVLHGINGPLTVAGTTYNGEMPHFQDKFSDEEIAAVVNHVRTSFGNSAPETTAATVAQIRAATADQTTPWQGDQDLGPLIH